MGRVPSVTIIHDFAETYGGAERIIAAAAEVLPEAPFWAIAGRRTVAERIRVADRFHTVLPENETVLRHYRALAPAYPSIAGLRRLPEADVLLSSSYAFAHHFRTRNDAPQVCYCYSPLRFAWSMTEDYAQLWASGRASRTAFRALAAGLRATDRRAAARVTRYVAESRFVAAQIRRVYNRTADVIYPPVDCDLFHPPGDAGHNGYYLFAGRLVEPYKRPGIVIDAFRSHKRRLIVAGDGPAYRELKEAASSNVEFVGHVDDEALVPLMQRCAGVIFPSIDDFGLIPVEAMACGRPVLSYAGGGALETVVAGKTGEFFAAQTASSLSEALERFDPGAYDPASIRAHAEAWRVSRFQTEMLRVISEAARVVDRYPVPV